jgi:hypothetical protein
MSTVSSINSKATAAESAPACVTVVCSECSDDTMKSGADGTLSCIRWDDGSLQPICADCRAERESHQHSSVAKADWVRDQFRYRVRITIEDIKAEEQRPGGTAATADGNRPDRVYDAAPGAAQAKPRSRVAASDPRTKKQ